MIQLSSRKKIILLSAVIIVIIILVIVLAIKNNNPKTPPSDNVLTSETPTATVVRDMTEAEKIDIGISPTEEVEVVNENNGLYIYRIKK